MKMESEANTRRALCRFVSETGEVAGNLIDLPLDITNDKLQLICNALLEQEENVPFIFFINDKEITGSLESCVEKTNLNTENVLDIIYQRQAIFRVRPITRCTSSMPGHAEAVIALNFSPDGKNLASGSGDTTVRFWDLNTQTPHFVCKGHKNWVLVLAWSPDSTRLASGCKSGHILLWDPNSGEQKGKQLVGHKQWITSLSWEPFHKNPDCRHLASSSKDGDVRIWDTLLGQCLRVLSGHVQGATCVRWGGSGLLYSASQDRTIKVWRADDGVLCRTLTGHAHWVNSLTLNTDYVLRIGPFDPVVIKKNGVPQPINNDRKFISTLRGHVQSVYMISWSPDSRLLVSGSADSTLKVWNIQKQKLELELPGHADEVYAVDWSPDGLKVASGGKDKLLRLLHYPNENARLTGHQQLINDVRFSPDTRLLASASFDKSIKIWDGRSGKWQS
ncbi:hypothetical protein J437_LFUL010587 [Ladona fulva]|uniref:NLE domain-containing protein n=1 Tax=Ladona fulva TaxID=123851 RepID=A0A8K0K9D7_LADFU|nr:hypothetical protein J437_LFUL010587 [Ladona fulva]